MPKMRRLSLLFVLVIFSVFIHGCGCAIFSPWPNASTVIRDTEATEIEAGKEFVIRYDYEHNLFPIYRATCDKNYLTLLSSKTEKPSDLPEANGTVWFLFKAINAGNTSITINEITHDSGFIQSRKTFGIHVVQP
jgi:hypothetical protein